MYLLPTPKEISIKEDKFMICYDTNIIVSSLCNSDVFYYGQILQKDVIDNLGYSLTIGRGSKENNSIYLTMNESLREEEYSLIINKDGIELSASSNAGILYGVQTLRQIIAQEGALVSALIMKDYPSIPNRGFYHDVTRGRIPTLEYLKAFADKLSYYKINQLQLYVEHSYLFKDFSEMWRDDTPLTAEEIMELDGYCKKLNIELVPSLSTFGHLFKLLNSKSYGHLRELPNYKPEKFTFLDRMEHHTIDVTNKDSLVLVKKMIEEFMPLFTSKHFNLCADETFDLGKGNSKGLAEEIGIKNMYVDYVKELCDFIISKGKRPMFWGDIICGFPEAIEKLPSEVICLNWGYSPEQREEETRLLHNAGATQYLCPGVGGWNQFINLIHSSYQNITRMCNYAHKYNALGVLNTDWGDFGHMNHPEFSTVGMIYGASFSWNDTIIPFEEINKQISRLEYKDRTEQFVSILASMSVHSIFGWNPAIFFMEVHSKKDYEDQKEEFEKFDFNKVEASNKEIRNLVINMYGLINSLDSSKRHLVKAYLVAAEGMAVFNTIGATIGSYKFGLSNLSVEEPMKIAERLEKWFYQYKQIWRTTSKESELFRIQNVICWYGDYLRDLQLNQ